MNNTLSIVCSIVIFLFPYLGRKRFNRQLLSSTVISLGLLGTFAGIMYGLWEFGVERIDQSIPRLLEGLKTAFLTSIAGMTASLILRLCPSVYGIPKTPAAEKETAENRLLQLLAEISRNTRPENTTAGEIRLLRQEIQTVFVSLNEKLDRIGRNEARINTEALSGALQDVVRHLDRNISEQINHTLSAIHDMLSRELGYLHDTQEINTELGEFLKKALTHLQESNRNAELFLNKSVNLNFRQNETLTTQMNNFGDFVKNTEEQFRTQLVRMEEKYERELSEMEKFTKTLLLIIKKLSQDHENLYKSVEQNN